MKTNSGRSQTFVLGFGVSDRPHNHFRRRRPGLKPIIKIYVIPFYLTEPRLPGDIRSLSTIVTGYTNRTLFGARWRRWFQRYSLIFCDTSPYITIHHLLMMAILFLLLQYLQYLYSQIDRFLTVSEVPVLGEVGTPAYHIKHIMYSLAAIVYYHVSQLTQFKTKNGNKLDIISRQTHKMLLPES